MTYPQFLSGVRRRILREIFRHRQVVTRRFDAAGSSRCLYVCCIRRGERDLERSAGIVSPYFEFQWAAAVVVRERNLTLGERAGHIAERNLDPLFEGKK
ncbi:hypothetical protein [Rhizobium sullae]|uniref:hypothetical protein n=1 Tax=Rhizobium sullae TaxID=50338 RepID=UPI001404B09C|nr:hypothetical protein [Rhizobium sullae]